MNTHHKMFMISFQTMITFDTKQGRYYISGSVSLIGVGGVSVGTPVLKWPPTIWIWTPDMSRDFPWYDIDNQGDCEENLLNVSVNLVYISLVYTKTGTRGVKILWQNK